MAGWVMAIRPRPSAMAARPIHWRLPTVKPNRRSAITASRTRPPASTTWTTDIGAIASARTWKTQAPVATSMPTANQRERNSPVAELTGWPKSTGGAAHAPAVLVEEPEVGDEGAQQCEENAEMKSHSG